MSHPGSLASMLTLQGKCSLSQAKAANSSGHLLRTSHVTQIITHTFQLDDGAKAFETAPSLAIKVVQDLEYSSWLP